MNFAHGTVANLTREWTLRRYVRVIRSQFSGTPLGVGQAASRFGSEEGNFLILYAAKNFTTALAEAVIRDRFECVQERRLFLRELSGWSAVEIFTLTPLSLLDIRKGGCLKLGISTDIAGAKHHAEARAFSQHIYNETDVAGILYASRLTGEDCIAIYDRAIEHHLGVTRVLAIDRMRQLADALESLSVKLVK